MPRYYCDYCDTYLTHDSPSVRKQHNAGYKHKANVRSYYQQFEEQQTQSLIDQRIKEHLGAFQHQVGATFNQHMMSLPPNSQGPRLPILPPPMLPIGASQPPAGPPLLPGVRPAGLPFPVVNAPGYNVPPPMAPPGAPSSHMQLNSLPRPPTMAPPSAIGVAMPIPNGSGSMANPVIYQANPLPSTSGGFNALSTPDASGLQSSATGVSQSYARISEAGH